MADQINGVLSPFLRDRRVAAAKPHLYGRVLDYGCGIGFLANLIPADRYLGVDIDAGSIATAGTAHPTHRFHTLKDFPADAGPFDTIVSLAVIEHVDDPAALLTWFAGMLAKGGRVVLTTPNPRFEFIHGFGAQLGLFSKEGHDEHQSLLDEPGLRRLRGIEGLELTKYRRFLFGANQLAIYSLSGEK